MGHVVKDHAFGCAGPYGAVGKWDNVRIEMHYYFIYTSRVCDKMCLAGQLAAGAGCELFIGFPNSTLIFTLLKLECLLH